MRQLARKPPVNLEEKDHWLFCHEYDIDIAATSIVILKRALTNEQLHFSENIKEHSVAAHNSVFFKTSSTGFFKKIMSGRLKFFATPHALITDSWSGGYFHWVADCLPRLQVLSNAGAVAPLLLPTFLKTFPFVQESLDMLKVPHYRFLKPFHWYLHSRLQFPVHLAATGNYNDIIMRQLRQRFNEGFDDVPQQKIYISRRNAGRRRLINEVDILAQLEARGFTIVFCENMSFLQQVQLFRRTKYLVSNHGAGLTNMLFMPAGGSVLELRRADDRHNNCYFSLAAAMQLNYHYLLCDASNESEDSHHANLKIHPAAFEHTLNNFLN